ncbi:MAG: hypothetical protein ABIK39_05655 [candidate division WOR-3 bacterium]
MKIRIIGVESFGVRSMCCVVETARHQVLIDPGVALAPRRFGLPPHKTELTRAALIREAILKEVEKATDIVITHFHGDHAPLAEPDEWQISLEEFASKLGTAQLWIKSRQGNTRLMEKRYLDFVRFLGERAVDADGRQEGDISFSFPVAHGESGKGTVMMVRIEDGGEVFVHASDVQLLDLDALAIILAWKPDIVFIDGPPLYLLPLHSLERLKATDNGRGLVQNIREVVIDHHLLRSKEGLDWLRILREEGKGKVFCGAEWMGLKVELLEAQRRELFQSGWKNQSLDLFSDLRIGR